MDREEKRIKKLRTEFLPEALEIVEKPMAPLGNIIIWMVFLLLAIFVIWACVGKMDEVATARGKVVSEDGIQQIQAYGSGVIKDVYIKEGDRVHKGDVLYTMDKEIDKLNIQYSEDNIGLDELRVELLDQLINDRDITAYQNGKFSKAQHEVIDFMIALDQQDGISVKEYEVAVENAKNQYTLAQSGLEIYSDKKDYVSDEQDIKNKEKKLGSAQEVELERLKENYQYLKEEADKYKRLYDAGAKAKAEWEAKVQERDNAKAQLEVKEIELGLETISDQENELALDYQASEADADYKNQEGAVAAAKNSYDAAVLNLNNAKAQRKTKLLELKEQYVKELKQYGVTLDEQYYEYENKDIIAQYDGVVKEVYVDKEGSVVTSTQVIAEILPDSPGLIVEAEIKNSDIGFVEAGQEVDIKVDTYNYQKYGKITGTVLYVSPDAAENEQREQIYKTNILIEEDKVNDMELSSGMQCSVEVKTDKRRVIAFFLEPLAEALDNSLNVR